MPLTKLGDDVFNVEKILKHIEGFAASTCGGERNMVELVGRLVRLQQQRIQELTARVQFLEQDAMKELREHQHRREAFAALLQQYEDLSQRYDLLMQRTR